MTLLILTNMQLIVWISVTVGPFPLYSQAAKLFTAMDKRVKHRQVGTSVYDAASTLFLNNNFDFCSSFPTFVKLILYILVENIRYILIS